MIIFYIIFIFQFQFLNEILWMELWSFPHVLINNQVSRFQTLLDLRKIANKLQHMELLNENSTFTNIFLDIAQLFNYYIFSFVIFVVIIKYWVMLYFFFWTYAFRLKCEPMLPEYSLWFVKICVKKKKKHIFFKYLIINKKSIDTNLECIYNSAWNSDSLQ